MKILKPGKTQTRLLYFAIGTCPKCECVIELEPQDLHYWTNAKDFTHTIVDLDRRTLGVTAGTRGCPNPGCRGKIDRFTFETREVPCE